MGCGTLSSENALSGRVNRPVPFLPREAWAQLLKGTGYHSHPVAQKKQHESGVLSVEPLYAFCILDPFMRFTQVSPVVAELTGYAVAELSCMGLQEIVALESMEATLTAFEKIDGLGWSHQTVRFYRKDGVKAEARIDTIRLTDDQYLVWFREIHIKAGTSLKVS
ncbi:PAS domain-containing protein [Holophaga foetida]|uniref:PAS domain-containing protein n=1 Tax=Holophaga foetida TaxID=35839 RepID=UPI0002473B1E|nr:PAS domain-containing protein [Holophaga foetida]